MAGLFIAGTDTGVGKTLVTAGLAGFLRQQGIDCGVMKPVESGVSFNDPSSDAFFLKEVSGVKDSLDLINIYSLAKPLAPGVAAEQENIEIKFEEIKKAYEKLTQLHSPILVEGAGGLLVPLNAKQTVTDLIQYLKLPVLLVGRLGLGTLNHTLLSLEYLKQRKLQVVGVVLSCGSASPDLSEQTNAQVLQAWTDTPLWGVVEHVNSPQGKDSIISAIQKGIGVKAKQHFKSYKGDESEESVW